MNTQIKLTYKGVQYCLEYNRYTIKVLEASGFNMNDFLIKPMTNIELAFNGLFLKNHPHVSQNIIDEIYEHCGDKSKLIATIKTMLDECYDSLLNEPQGDDEGNVSWEIVDLSPKKKVQE
nr:MAG TPA: protein of unknown function (DUF5055) [Bacteriophage sp.]